MNNGLAVLKRCSIDAKGASMTVEDEAILSLYRHLLVSVDGMRSLILEASVEPCDSLLRAEFEALISLLYIVEAPSQTELQRRGSAYVVADLKRQLGELKRFDPSTAEGKQARAKFNKDRYVKGILLPTVKDLPLRIDRLEKRLQEQDVLAAAQEYDQQKKRPNWHALFSGPPSLEQVADTVGLSGSYEFLYRLWSGFVHGTDAVRERRSADWRPLHTIEQAGTVGMLATGFALRATQTVLLHYRPGEEQSYKSWYTSEIKPIYSP